MYTAFFPLTNISQTPFDTPSCPAPGFTGPAPIGDVTLEVLWRFNHSMHHAGFDTKTRDRFWEIGASAAPHLLAAAAVAIR